jgi:hypothetical protein
VGQSIVRFQVRPDQDSARSLCPRCCPSSERHDVPERSVPRHVCRALLPVSVRIVGDDSHNTFACEVVYLDTAVPVRGDDAVADAVATVGREVMARDPLAARWP